MKKLLFAILLTAIMAPLAHAQNPFAEPKNLKVLPETIKGDQLRQIMHVFHLLLVRGAHIAMIKSKMKTVCVWFGIRTTMIISVSLVK